MRMKMFDDLRQFTNWWWRHDQPTRPPGDAYRTSRATQSLILFRAGQFQVEQVTLLPGFVVPVHAHPNVGTYECHIIGTGDAWLMRSGRWDKIPYTTRLDRSPRFKRLLINRGQLHKGVAHSVNVVLSFQHWADDTPPSFIADDWHQPDKLGWPDGQGAPDG